MEENNNENNETNETKTNTLIERFKNNKKQTIIGCIAVIAVLAVAMTAIAISGNGNESNSNPANNDSSDAIADVVDVEATAEETMETTETTEAQTTTSAETGTTTEVETTTYNSVTSDIYSPESISAKISELREIFPAGSYWNHKEGESYDKYAVTNTPCDHKTNGEGTCNLYKGISNTVYHYAVQGTQCLGFASMLSDYIFGADTPVSRYSDYDKIRVGDQARINNESHSVLIIEKTDDYIVVAECNADYRTCIIQWDRKIYRSELENEWYITRYE